MDIIINTDLGYCGVLPDRRSVLKDDGKCYMMNCDGSWRLMTETERDLRFRKASMSLNDCINKIKKSKSADQLNHRSVDRVRGTLRSDIIKLDSKNYYIRTV